MYTKIARPYCYKITNIHTNQFYIGSRYSKNIKHYSEDFGIIYFTSSVYVKQLGFENFKIDWIEEFPTAESAYDWEQMMIHVNLKDPLCLNKHCTFGKKKRFNVNGKNNPCYDKNLFTNKLTNEQKYFYEKPSDDWIKGSSIEFKNKMKIITSGENNGCHNRKWITNGLIQEFILLDENFIMPKNWWFGQSNKTKELKKNSSINRKSPNFTERICPHCNLSGKGGNMTRYHFDNCKHIIKLPPV